MYQLEDGVECTPEEFWGHRTQDFWNDDWDFAKNAEDPITCIAAREYGCSYAEVDSAMRNHIKGKYRAMFYGTGPTPLKDIVG